MMLAAGFTCYRDSAGQPQCHNPSVNVAQSTSIAVGSITVEDTSTSTTRSAEVNGGSNTVTQTPTGAAK